MAPRASMHLRKTSGATKGACGTGEVPSSPLSAFVQKSVCQAQTTCGFEASGDSAAAS